jgi:hypothetical protein
LIEKHQNDPDIQNLQKALIECKITDKRVKNSFFAMKGIESAADSVTSDSLVLLTALETVVVKRNLGIQHLYKMFCEETFTSIHFLIGHH